MFVSDGEDIWWRQLRGCDINKEVGFGTQKCHLRKMGNGHIPSVKLCWLKPHAS